MRVTPPRSILHGQGGAFADAPGVGATACLRQLGDALGVLVCIE